MPKFLKPMTAEEFWGFVNRPENSDRRFELDSGFVFEFPLNGRLHGFLCANAAALLTTYAAARKHGYACCGSGIIVERNPDTVLAPDVSFFDDGRTYGTMERGFSKSVPRLVVEVLSSSQEVGEMNHRVKRYLRFGVAAVWVVDWGNRTVSIFPKSREHYFLSERDELVGDDMLPDFRCKVAKLFGLPFE